MNEYGPGLVNYIGVGILELADESLDCRFEACQLRDGKILLRCELSEIGLARLLSPSEPKQLTGRTHDGHVVTVTGLRETNYLASSDSRERTHCLAYLGTYLSVIRESYASTSSTFALTNFTLSSQELRVPHPSAQHAYISRAREYVNAIRRLKAVSGIDVTAYLHVQADSVAKRDTVANELCYLLSVACGTKVQWIAREDLTDEKLLVGCHHAARITKRYCGLPTIDPRHPTDMSNYLAMTLPTFADRAAKWTRLNQLIDTYLDAKAEADYLELRGIKLAVTMEVLKEAFIAATRQRRLAAGEEEFDGLRSDLKRAIQHTLKAHGWDAQQRAIAYGNLAALNRVSFLDHLFALCQHLSLPLLEAEIKLFARCRDTLVHQGKFHAQVADACDRNSLPSHSGPAEEYFWLLHMVDRLVLLILGYRGPHIDCSAQPMRRVETF